MFRIFQKDDVVYKPQKRIGEALGLHLGTPPGGSTSLKVVAEKHSEMKPVDILPTLRNIEMAWLDLASSYESIGHRNKAQSLRDELTALMETDSDDSAFKEKYFKHLQEWEMLGG